MAGRVRPEEAVGATLYSLPAEIVVTIGVTASPSEDSVSEERSKLEFLEMQEKNGSRLIMSLFCYCSTNPIFKFTGSLSFP